MFPRKKTFRRIQPVHWRQQEGLVEDLRTSLHENAYLLDLLQEYTLKGIHQMRWGNFYRLTTPYSQVLYQDITGLVMITKIDAESLPIFAELLDRSSIRATRIIGREESAAGLHAHLEKLSDRWSETRVIFPEVGMVADRQSLSDFGEPELRTAEMSDAQGIAEGSTRAMAEEIGVEVQGEDFDRLVRSKADLIERGRYYLLKQGKEILFQGYLSARMPEVSQIQGIWVPPKARNRGIATRCVAEMCRRVLRFSQSVVLRVQTRNHPARKVYEKVGFEPFLDYRSIWFK